MEAILSQVRNKIPTYVPHVNRDNDEFRGHRNCIRFVGPWQRNCSPRRLCLAGRVRKKQNAYHEQGNQMTRRRAKSINQFHERISFRCGIKRVYLARSIFCNPPQPYRRTAERRHRYRACSDSIELTDSLCTFAETVWVFRIIVSLKMQSLFFADISLIHKTLRTA